MLFNLKLFAKTEKISFTNDSAYVKFLLDSDTISKEISKIEKDLKLTFPKRLVNNFLSEKGSELKYHHNQSPDLIMINKVKFDKYFTADYFRNYFAGLIKSIKEENIKSLQIELPEFNSLKKYFSDESYLHQSVIEGCYLGNYAFNKFKSDAEKPKQLKINLHTKNSAKLKKTIQETENLIKAITFTKDLVNDPAISLTPKSMAAQTKSNLTKAGVKVTIFDEKQIKKMNMTAVLAVGGASDNPPRFIVMNYKPKVKTKKKIVLVGKGVTFDSGGLSIKPSDGMIEMKADMAGAGAVIGILYAAALNKLPIEVVGVVPAVENMISGNAYRPGDIVRTSSGKSIDIGNTDAEGRVILADALEYASKMKPDEIIDFATLTGACVVALGQNAAGILTHDDNLFTQVSNAGYKTWERVWRLPLWHEYHELIKSDLADVKNVGPRWAGAITAAKFLEYFVDENIPWAHIDLAGPAIHHKLNNYTDTYETGFGVRLIYEYLKQQA
ncbi:MAG: leucyl aminopeptidase [Melioribacteraceae bacterium]|nr:leucyl aminopeptidase [Melioribacteraceae bacterium]MCF8355646.1 leucyl aminopeptidase [Melioribacteraceae bacterium]MCF8394654.1 leucyl aminopeptidase [Melioribacteraceae bacterium]MCF8418012.1 leucyl aminopeptidase [Melioribacteraceae bacterium]